mmetsp:Transcript_7187/g.14550  ORF Transcript_7187/g.14550 Transcript_7187/m.14550 type:complete len:482 (+) Transcript_7187:234-1679(+)
MAPIFSRITLTTDPDGSALAQANRTVKAAFLESSLVQIGFIPLSPIAKRKSSKISPTKLLRTKALPPPFMVSFSSFDVNFPTKALFSLLFSMNLQPSFRQSIPPPSTLVSRSLLVRERHPFSTAGLPPDLDSAPSSINFLQVLVAKSARSFELGPTTFSLPELLGTTFPFTSLFKTLKNSSTLSSSTPSPLKHLRSHPKPTIPKASTSMIKLCMVSLIFDPPLPLIPSLSRSFMTKFSARLPFNLTKVETKFWLLKSSSRNISTASRMTLSLEMFREFSLLSPNAAMASLFSNGVGSFIFLSREFLTLFSTMSPPNRQNLSTRSATALPIPILEPPLLSSMKNFKRAENPPVAIKPFLKETAKLVSSSISTLFPISLEGWRRKSMTCIVYTDLCNVLGLRRDAQLSSSLSLKPKPAAALTCMTTVWFVRMLLRKSHVSALASLPPLSSPSCSKFLSIKLKYLADCFVSPKNSFTSKLSPPL